MRFKRMFKRGLSFLIMATLAVAVFGFLVMSLWNWLMPAIFGWPALGFWQALGLLVLARILFGGLRGGHGHFGRSRHWRHRMEERWEKMTPEEREQFRAGMRGRCGRAAFVDLGAEDAEHGRREPPAAAQPTA
jgi:hypothetical protein